MGPAGVDLDHGVEGGHLGINLIASQVTVMGFYLSAKSDSQNLGDFELKARLASGPASVADHSTASWEKLRCGAACGVQAS